MTDDAPKSAYELVMERLRKKDAEAGIGQRTLTDEARTAIAEVRKTYEAKLAEQHVLHQSALAKTLDPEARATLEEDFRRDREQLTSERDVSVDRIRNGETAG